MTVSEPETAVAGADQFSVTLSVSVTNTGSVIGSEVVQVYVSLPKGGLANPDRQLRAFHKVKDLAPGKAHDVSITLDKYAVSYWDDLVHKWKADKGAYTVYVGSPSESTATFELQKSFEWSGL